MKTVWLFPGQGAQHVGMGKDLFDRSPVAKAVFEEADATLGFSLSTLCFEGPLEELTLTANAQPALLTVSTAAQRVLEHEAGKALPLPVAAAGHSLGEYSALVAAGAMRFADALHVVRRRGQAMQRAVPEGQGGMLALLGGTAKDVEALCDAARGDGDVLSPANYNCPGQVVIAGSSGAIERATALAKERKLKAIALNVSAPFHCALMEPASEEVKNVLSNLELGSLRFPVVSNVTAQPTTDAAQAAKLLVEQCSGAVRWQQTVEWMVSAGAEVAFEFGPGKVLAGLNRKTSKGLTTVGVGDSQGLEQALELLSK